MARKKIEEIVEEKEAVIEELPNTEKVEEVEDDIAKLFKHYKGGFRGFKDCYEAYHYPETEAFKKLDIGCQTEYKEWLNSIIKEEK